MAQQVGASSQWEEFESLNQRIRTNIDLMMQQRNTATSKSETDRLFNETCKMFTYLKALQHKSLSRREASQCELSNLCKQVDHHSLGVKNFAYEQTDTLKQIAICNAFASHPNEPKLVSKDVFYAKNPQPPITNAHQEMTERLKFELLQRKEFGITSTFYTVTH